MTELQVIARYTVAEGREPQLLALLPQLAEASRREPGNLAFDVYRELGDPRGVVLLERYASREAFAEHRQSAHFTRLVLEQIVPLLDSRTVELYDATE
ncbi:antibiotic biosynthesis monooxygenase [Streptomyces sp. PTM05]|uniref:Antibiotic biosynthesis monooxygenase n=1 Tax=Streptantibioticus parmotrematis TaxID=2873249 RepID=A0ABS7R0J1_9ACTN|nr:putative quinol monooxygenase [Streptantibioticus parmotrematis]MBY8888986.1 antibiotic biosynthesis monooxygenase [Streptantibioticus parmotrematis]